MDLTQFQKDEYKRPGNRFAWNIPVEFSSQVEEYLLSLGEERKFSGSLFASAEQTGQGVYVQSYGKAHDKFYIVEDFTEAENNAILLAMAKAAAEAEKY